MTAIYARQSVERRESISIDMQVEACKRLIPENTEIRIYTDRGFTGTNTARPAFQEMLCEIRAGKIRAVYVYKLDRISRSLCDFAAMMRLFREHGTKLYSCRENFDTASEIGNMLLHLLMMFAELEQKTIAGRVRDNYYARAAGHLPLGGTAPYGYRTIATTVNGKNTTSLSPISDEAAQVKWFYTHYALYGENVEQLVHAANHSGKLTRHGARWSNSAVLRILRNPVYIRGDLRSCVYLQEKGVILTHPIASYCDGNGWLLYGDKHSRHGEKWSNLKGEHLAAGLHSGIVDANLWLAVQQRLSHRGGNTTRGTGHTSWLQGCVTCGLCGLACYTRWNGKGKQYTYLVCRGKRQGICGGIPALRVGDVEAAVEPVLMQCVAQVLPHAEEGAPPKADPTEIALEELEARMQRIAAAMGEPSAAVPYLRRELETLAQKRHALEQEQKLRQTSPRSNKELIRRWEHWWGSADIAQRRCVIELLVQEIRVFPEKVEVYLA